MSSQDWLSLRYVLLYVSPTKVAGIAIVSRTDKRITDATCTVFYHSSQQDSRSQFIIDFINIIAIKYSNTCNKTFTI